MSWQTGEAEDGRIHVAPIDPAGQVLPAHEPSIECPCRPRLVREGPLDEPVVSHREPGHPGALDRYDA